MTQNIWDAVLERLHERMSEEDFRRWFSPTAYASDSGDQVTVWVPTESVRRHIDIHFSGHIADELAALDRRGTQIRMIVAGMGDEDDE